VLEVSHFSAAAPENFKKSLSYEASISLSHPRVPENGVEGGVSSLKKNCGLSRPKRKLSA